MPDTNCLLSCSYFSRTAIPALYESVRERVKQDLAEVFLFSATVHLTCGHTLGCAYTELHCALRT